MVAASRLPFGMPSWRTFMVGTPGESYHARLDGKASVPRSARLDRRRASARGARMKLGGARARRSAASCEAATATSRSPASPALEDAAPGTLTFLADRRLEAHARDDARVGDPARAATRRAVAAPVAARARIRTSRSCEALELFHPPRARRAGHPSDGRRSRRRRALGAGRVGRAVRRDRRRVRHRPRRRPARAASPSTPTSRIGDDFVGARRRRRARGRA